MKKPSQMSEQDPPPRFSYGSMTVDVVPVGSQRHHHGHHCAPSRRCCCHSSWDCVGTCTNVVFLLVHGVVSWCIGLLLLTLVLLSVALLPLCGLGLLVFNWLFTLGIVDFCAKCDAAMTNYVTSAQDQIQVDSGMGLRGRERERELLRDWEEPPERLISGLSRVSTESATVLTYLVSIKLILASIGLAVVAIVTLLPLLLVHTLLSGRSGLLGEAPSSSGWEVLCAYTAVVLMLQVAFLSVDLVVRICNTTTRFFCCERVYTLSLPRPGGAHRSPTRPRVVVVRLPSSSSAAAAAFVTTSSSSQSGVGSSTVATSQHP